MDFQLLLGLLLTIMPIVELRGGLPVVIHYLIKENLPIFPFFVLVLILNIGVIFFIFFFLDYLHIHFLKINLYRKFMEKYLQKIQTKGDKVNHRMEKIGFLALALFVGVPFPGTGAWTGSLIAWVLNLNRKKSIAAISLGVIIAGVIILITSLIFEGVL
jgi:uncharacterized membrane protein